MADDAANQKTAQNYMPQLDGLRALAVIAVAWSHWGTVWFPAPFIQWGGLGVRAFFVISGFLITGILLDNRDGASRISVLKQFYLRRTLRIFPLFYLTLLVAALWRADGIAESWPWHVSYLSNVYFYLHGWIGQLSHFWSLAVEEQFYLFWPLLVIFLPRRLLLPLILASVILSLVFKVGMMHSGFKHAPNISANILMPGCLDALGLGALLAYGIRNDFPMNKLSRWFLIAGLAGCLTLGPGRVFAPALDLAQSFILAWVVYMAAIGLNGPAGWLLAKSPLNYLGKISYGLYVFHNFASSLYLAFIAYVGSPGWLMKLYAIPPLRIAIFTALTIGLAAYSWHRFEKPLMGLKRKFPYPTDLAVNPPRTDIPSPSP